MKTREDFKTYDEFMKHVKETCTYHHTGARREYVSRKNPIG